MYVIKRIFFIFCFEEYKIIYENNYKTDPKNLYIFFIIDIFYHSIYNLLNESCFVIILK